MKNRTRLIFIISISCVLIFTFISIQNSDKKPFPNTFSSSDLALQAGIDEAMKIYDPSGKNSTAIKTIFSHKLQQSTYFVNKFSLNGKDGLTYSENLFIIKILPKDNGYIFQQGSSLFAVKQINEKGEVMHPVWTLPLEDQLTFIVGKKEESTIMYEGRF